jgi:hypothetical protein
VRATERNLGPGGAESAATAIGRAGARDLTGTSPTRRGTTRWCAISLPRAQRSSEATSDARVAVDGAPAPHQLRSHFA